MDVWNIIIAICAIVAVILSITNSIILYFHNKRIAQAQEKTAEATKKLTELSEREFAQKSKLSFIIKKGRISGNKIKFKITPLCERPLAILLDRIESITDTLYEEPSDKTSPKEEKKYIKYDESLRTGDIKEIEYILPHSVIGHYDFIDFIFRFIENDKEYIEKYHLDIKNSPSSPWFSKID